MTSVLLKLIYTFQAGFSGYNLYLASICIPKLQKYEDKSKKAAEYSNIAENQLWKTRATQASSTLALVLSFITSAVSITRSQSRTTGFVIALLNLGVLVAARIHVSNFWKEKTKIPLPGVKDYNDAIALTKTIRLNLAYLAAVWFASGGVSFML